MAPCRIEVAALEARTPVARWKSAVCRVWRWGGRSPNTLAFLVVTLGGTNPLHQTASSTAHGILSAVAKLQSTTRRVFRCSHRFHGRDACCLSVGRGLRCHPLRVRRGARRSVPTCRRGSSPGLQPKPAPQRQAVATHPRFGWLTGASPPLASAPAPSNGRRTSWTSRRINALLRGLSTPCPSFIQRQGLLRTKYIRYILSACQLGLRVETKGHY